MYKILIAIVFIANVGLANSRGTDTTLIKLSYLIDNNTFNDTYNISSDKLYKHPDLIESYLRILLINKRYDYFENIVSDMPSKFNSEKWYYQTQYYTSLGKYDSAFYCLKNLVVLPKKPARSLLRTDSILSPLHKFSQWDSIWSHKYYSSYNIDIESIEHDIKNKDYNLALITIDKYTKRKNIKTDILYYRSLIYNKQGIYNSAITDIKAAIKKRSRIEKYYYLYAQELYTLKRFRKAKKAIENAINLNPNNWKYYSLAINIYESIKQYKKAYEYCKIYLACDTTNVDALVCSGRLLYKLNDYLNGLKYLNIANKYDLNNPYLHLWRAKIYKKMKIFRSAIHDYNISIDFLSDNANLYFERGLCKFGVKSMKKGCIDIKRAYDMGVLEAGKVYLSKCEK